MNIEDPRHEGASWQKKLNYMQWKKFLQYASYTECMCSKYHTILIICTKSNEMKKVISKIDKICISYPNYQNAWSCHTLCLGSNMHVFMWFLNYRKGYMPKAVHCKGRKMTKSCPFFLLYWSKTFCKTFSVPVSKSLCRGVSAIGLVLSIIFCTLIQLYKNFITA